MSTFLIKLISNYGYFGMFLGMVLEAVIIIIPSELILATGGILASREIFSLFGAFYLVSIRWTTFPRVIFPLYLCQKKKICGIRTNLKVFMIAISWAVLQWKIFVLTRAFTRVDSIIGKRNLKKGAKNRPLTEEQKENNRIKSKVRSRVEHIFGFM